MTQSAGGIRRAALAFILVTVVLDMLAMGVVLPVLPELVLGFLGGDTARAAWMMGLFGTVWALMQWLWSPLLGMLSDRFGRRPVILLSNLGLGLDYILMALAPGLGLLLLGRVISGITAASISTSGAYIADTVPPERRAGAFGLLSVGFGVGFICGPALGGILGGISPRLPFWVAAGLSLANFAYGLVVLPESLPRERRDRFRWSRANPVGSLVLLGSQPMLLGLAAVNFIATVAHGSLPNVFVLYADYRYGWNANAVGLALAAVGASSIVTGGLIVPRVVARFGERRSLIAGLGFGMAGFAMIGLASTGGAFLAAIPVLGLWGLSGPAVQGLMTRRVAASEQGQLQGANTSLQSVAGLIGPGLFSAIFASFIGYTGIWHQPGAPYLVAALFMAGAAALAWRVTRGAA